MTYEILITCLFNRTPIHNNLLLTAVEMRRNQICVLKWLQSCKTDENRQLVHTVAGYGHLTEREHSIKKFYAEHQYYSLFDVDGCQQVITVLISCSLRCVSQRFTAYGLSYGYWLTIP
jgi:hypothetical protein